MVESQSRGYHSRWGTALERFQQRFDAVLCVLFVILVLILTPLGVFALVGGLTRGGEDDTFLIAIGLANLLAAALFVAAIWLVRSRDPKLTAWRMLASVGALIYFVGFVLPFLNRVWYSVQVNGRSRLLHNVLRHSELLWIGGLTIRELGVPILVCIVLLEARAAVAHLQARANGTDAPNHLVDR